MHNDAFWYEFVQSKTNVISAFVHCFRKLLHVLKEINNWLINSAHWCVLIRICLKQSSQSTKKIFTRFDCVIAILSKSKSVINTCSQKRLVVIKDLNPEKNSSQKRVGVKKDLNAQIT